MPFGTIKAPLCIFVANIPQICLFTNLVQYKAHPTPESSMQLALFYLKFSKTFVRIYRFIDMVRVYNGEQQFYGVWGDNGIFGGDWFWPVSIITFVPLCVPGNWMCWFVYHIFWQKECHQSEHIASLCFEFCVCVDKSLLDIQSECIMRTNPSNNFNMYLIMRSGYGLSIKLFFNVFQHVKLCIRIPRSTWYEHFSSSKLKKENTLIL